MLPPPHAQAIHFGDEALPAVGWFHPASDPRGVPVLVCPPWGREQESAHRAVRLLCERLAARGQPALRIDYPGTGDAAGDEFTGHLLTAWLASVDAAIAELRSRTGARQVAVVGWRIGALLAAEVAARRDDVAAFAAIAPVAGGRAFVRELTALQAASLPVGRAPAQAQLLEAGGHSLAASTRDALSRLDLKAIARSPAPHVLLVDRDEAPSADAWRTHFAALGADVRQVAHAGFPDLMQDPHRSVLPEAMLAEVLGWLGDVPGAAVDPADVRPPVPRVARVAPGVVERFIAIETAGTRILAIASHGEQPHGATDVLVLLNSGAQRSAGPGRLHARLGRRLAARGIVVLRVDLAGLGDSAARANESDNVVYPVAALGDIEAVLRHVRVEWPQARTHLAGICSGSYHALQAARHGLPVDRVIAINPLTFDWPGNQPLLEPLPAHKVTQEMSRYRRNLFSAAPWLKMMRGEVDVGRIAVLLARRASQGLAARARDLARAVHWPLRDDLGVELQRAADTGIEIRFVFCEGEPGEDLLRQRAGRVVGRLQRAGRLHVHRLSDADHTFTGAAARDRLEALFEHWLVAAATTAGGCGCGG